MTMTTPEQLDAASPGAATGATTATAGVEQTPVALALRDIAPFALSLLPFSIALGSAAAATGLARPEAAGSAVFILAGGAQLAAIELLAGGAGAAVVLGTVALINFRLALYGAGVGRWFADAPRWQQVALASVAIDQNYLVTEQRLDDLPSLPDRRQYFLTATACLVLTFLSCQVVGYQLGAVLPTSLGLHLAGPLLFAAMLTKTVVGRRQAITAGVAAAMTLATIGVLGGAALPVATIVALIVGARTDRSS